MSTTDLAVCLTILVQVVIAAIEAYLVILVKQLLTFSCPTLDRRNSKYSNSSSRSTLDPLLQAVTYERGQFSTRRQNRKSVRSGVAALEFALVAPVFLLFVFAFFEIGRMLMVQQSLTNAAREGCRRAAIATTLNSADVDQTVRDCLKSVTSKATDPGTIRVTVPANLADFPTGSELTVAVEADYFDVTWIPLGHWGLGAKLSAAHTARRE